jgi:hypothetical protein
MTDLSVYRLAGRTGTLRELGVRGRITSWRDIKSGVLTTFESLDGERFDNVPLTDLDLDPEASSAPRPEQPDLSDLPARQIAAGVLEAARRGERISQAAAQALAKTVLRGAS